MNLLDDKIELEFIVPTFNQPKLFLDFYLENRVLCIETSKRSFSFSVGGFGYYWLFLTIKLGGVK